MAPDPALPAILAEAKTWLVIDKPAGLAVHPGPRTPDSLEQLLPAYAQHGLPPQPVHRLDRDTSGCLLLARRPSALRALSRAFATGAVGKTYLALVTGEISSAEGRIVAALAKRSSQRAGWRMEVEASGQAAETDWRCLGSRDGLSLVAFRPLTGRTHQIRVHATLLGRGTAIAGDPVYGGAGTADAAAGAGLMLHARALRFPEPQGGEMVQVSAPVPARFAALAPDLARLAAALPAESA